MFGHRYIPSKPGHRALNLTYMHTHTHKPLRLQYEGLQSGYELKIRFFDQTAVAAWPWAVDFFQAPGLGFRV